MLKKFILCKYKTVNFQLHESMNNPYIYWCSNEKCRKLIYLRNNSVFWYFQCTLASSIFFIFKYWLLEEKNRHNIYDFLKENLPSLIISKKLILEILTKIRFITAHYIKDTYIIEDISSEKEYAIYKTDESLFKKLIMFKNLYFAYPIP